MSAEFVSGVFKDMPWHFGMAGGAKESDISGKLLSIPEAGERSGLKGQEIERVPLFHCVDGVYLPVDTHIGVRDKASNTIYGVHGSDVYQEKDFWPQIEVLISALDRLGHDPNVVDTMGLLYGGSVAFATLAFPEFQADLPDGSPLLPFLNWVSSHSGRYAWDIRQSNIRQVCANTVGMSQSAGGRGLRAKARHTGSMDAAIAVAVDHVMQIPARIRATVATAEALLGLKLTDENVRTVLDTVIPVPVLSGDGKNQKAVTMATNRQWDVFSIYQSKPDLQDVKGTGWGLYNAFTDYNDHWARFNNSKLASAAENRYLKTIWGQDTIADKALDVLAGMVVEASPSKVV